MVVIEIVHLLVMGTDCPDGYRHAKSCEAQRCTSAFAGYTNDSIIPARFLCSNPRSYYPSPHSSPVPNRFARWMEGKVRSESGDVVIVNGKRFDRTEWPYRSSVIGGRISASLGLVGRERADCLFDFRLTYLYRSGLRLRPRLVMCNNN